MKWRRVSAVAAVALTVGLLCAQPARAEWAFSPSALEWASWPIYCRVQYSWVNSGYNYEYADTYPPAAVASWKSIIGEQIFHGMHHWCASIHYLNRAKAAGTKRDRDFLLSQAEGDAIFSFARADTSSPVYPNMAITMAMIRAEKGERDKAREILEIAKKAQPSRTEPYSAMALLYRQDKQLELARKELLDAVAAIGKPSAELQYNLGLINFDLKNYDESLQNAHEAYRLGFPLPGLRDKLRQVNRWQEAPRAATPADATRSVPASGG